MIVSGTGVAPLQKNVPGVDIQYKIAASYKEDDFAYTIDGESVVIDTAGGIATPTRMFIGSNRDAGASQNGHIARAAYWNVELSDADLVTVTT